MGRRLEVQPKEWTGNIFVTNTRSVLSYLEFGIQSEEDVYSGVGRETSSDRKGGNLTIILTLEGSCGVTLQKQVLVIVLNLTLAGKVSHWSWIWIFLKTAKRSENQKNETFWCEASPCAFCKWNFKWTSNCSVSPQGLKAKFLWVTYTIGVVPVVEVSISSGFTSQNFGGARKEADRSGQTIHTECRIY